MTYRPTDRSINCKHQQFPCKYTDILHDSLVTSLGIVAIQLFTSHIDNDMIGIGMFTCSCHCTAKQKHLKLEEDNDDVLPIRMPCTHSSLRNVVVVVGGGGIPSSIPFPIIESTNQQLNPAQDATVRALSNSCKIWREWGFSCINDERYSIESMFSIWIV